MAGKLTAPGEEEVAKRLHRSRCVERSSSLSTSDQPELPAA